MQLNNQEIKKPIYQMFQTKTLKFTTSINKLIKQKLKFVTVCTVLLVSDWLCALYC